MKITVTKEDIQNGVPGDATCCAIALAVKRCCNLTEVDDISVDDSTIKAGDTEYRTPPVAEKFIEKFDADKETVEPFEFDLDTLYVREEAFDEDECDMVVAFGL